MEGEVSLQTLDYIVGANAGSFAMLSCVRYNPIGIAAAGVYILNHFFLLLEQEYMDNPKEDVYNYGYCIFVITIKTAIAKFITDTRISKYIIIASELDPFYHVVHHHTRNLKRICGSYTKMIFQSILMFN